MISYIYIVQLVTDRRSFYGTWVGDGAFQAKMAVELIFNPLCGVQLGRHIKARHYVGRDRNPNCIAYRLTVKSADVDTELEAIESTLVDRHTRAFHDLQDRLIYRETKITQFIVSGPDMGAYASRKEFPSAPDRT